MRVAIRTLLAALLLAGCAAKPYYWTKPGAGEGEFTKASKLCRFQALGQAGPLSRGRCTYDPASGRQYCRDFDDFELAQEEERREQRVQRFYSRCMEGRGWASNHEGLGFHQKFGSKPPPEAE